MRTKSLLLLGIAVAAFIAGCNTSKGVGKDIENTGENIQQGVEKAR